MQRGWGEGSRPPPKGFSKFLDKTIYSTRRTLIVAVHSSIAREGPRGSPFGIKTKLDWTVTGTLPRHSRDLESVCFIHVDLPKEELNELVKTLWKTESFYASMTAMNSYSKKMS